MHIDHFHPLSKGGKHSIDNLVASCAKCNLSKGSKDPYVFAKQIGKELIQNQS
jgi:5-methylcytosine-specific restriction endonuclease McrA